MKKIPSVPSIYKDLQKLEEELIQINGLVLALQELMPDGSAHNCVANELEERLKNFQGYFYEFWEKLPLE
jgi:SepF-like predicted cell division protein (DUF552 family)